MITFSAGRRLRAAQLNELQAETTYTPTWTASAGTPNIEDGTLTGRYTGLGKRYWLTINWLAGPATTYGTAGAHWIFGLPSGHVTAGVFSGTVMMLDASTLEYGGLCRTVAAASTLEMFKPVSGRILNNTPFTPGNGDSMTIDLSYVIV